MKIRKRISAILGISFLICTSVSFIVSASNRTGESYSLASLSMSEAEDVKAISESIMGSDGKTYSGNVLEFDSSNGSLATYDLNGEFETLHINIVCSNKTDGSSKIDVGIFADGKRSFELIQYSYSAPAKSVDLDVRGVGKLTISTASRESGGFIYFVDSVLYRADTPAPYHTYTMLQDIATVENKGQDFWKSLGVDNAGHPHNGVSEFNPTSGEASCTYLLEQKYLGFKGAVYMNLRTDPNSVTNFYIYLDGNLAYSKEGLVLDMTPEIFNLDVTNVNQLKIVCQPAAPDELKRFVYVSDAMFFTEKLDHEHIPGEWVVTKAATCSAEGEQTVYCVECNEMIETQVIPPLPHTPDGKVVEVSQPTCTTQGKRAQHCTVCGAETEIENISILGHSAGEWKVVTPATCENDGLESATCERCGADMGTRVIPKKDHVPGETLKVVRKATCKQMGLRQTLCTECGAVLGEENIPLTKEHDFTKWVTIEGNIWDTPVVQERVCKICGQIEHREKNSTAWLKPLTIVLLLLTAFVVVERIRLKKTPKFFINEVDTALCSPQAFSPDDVKGQLFGINEEYEVTPAHLEAPSMPQMQMPQQQNPVQSSPIQPNPMMPQDIKPNNQK